PSRRRLCRHTRALASSPSRLPPSRLPAAPEDSDELDEDHLRRIATARAELEDARIAARALRIARREFLEQLVHRELVLRERRERLAARVQIAALGQRDQLLDLRLDRLRLGLRGPHALVLDDLLAQVHEQRLAMGAVAAELVPVLLVSHGLVLFSRGRVRGLAPGWPWPRRRAALPAGRSSTPAQSSRSERPRA